MLPVDGQLLRQLAPSEPGQRAIRQNEIIEGMGGNLAATLDQYDINTPLRIAHFLAQVAEESDGFCTTEEYASGQAYEGRADLGNTQQGDGRLFKGRGLIQLTGRANYASVAKILTLDLVNEPLMVNDPYVYLLVSCVFWTQKNINAFCDADDVISVTHAVNGGLTGIDVRKTYLAHAKKLIAPLVGASADPPGSGLPVLFRGSTGDAVTNVQRLLVSKGYPLALDGDFGAATEVAVKHLQVFAALAPDGVVGAKTWAALEDQP